MVCVLEQNVLTDYFPHRYLSGQNDDLHDCSAFAVSQTNTDVLVTWCRSSQMVSTGDW